MQSPVPTEPSVVSPRARELDTLKGWLADDHGTAVLVRGRCGVGKDRLADELIRHAHGLPKTIVLDARVPTAGGRSFHPYGDIAHQAILWAEQHGLTEEIVEPLDGALSAVLEPSPVDATEPGSFGDKLGFFDGFRSLLTRLSTWARPVIVVRDLERADPDTLELTSYLVGELFGDPSLDPDSARPGLLLLLARDQGSTPDAARDVIDDIAETRTTRQIDLQGLDLDGLRNYVQSPQILEKLLLASDGLPQELDAIFDTLPANVEELVLRRISTLSTLAQDSLRALAIAEQPATARTIAGVIQQPTRATAQALKELREARLLHRRINNGEFQFAFARRRDLEVVRDTLSDQDRRQLHHGWAQALAKEPDTSAPALLAFHQLRSTEPQRGVSLAVKAAETYAVAGALHAAVQVLDAALPFAAGELQLAIVTRLADLAPLIGAPSRALRHVEALKDLLPESERGRAFLREAVLRNKAGDHELALESLEHARALVPESDAATRAEIESAASEAHYHRSALDLAADAALTGLDWLQRVEPPATAERTALLNQLGKVALASGDHATALAHYEENLAAAERSGLQGALAIALVNISVVHLRRGDHQQAEAFLNRSIETAKTSSDLPTTAFASMTVGALHHQRGQIGRAIEAYRDCRALFRRLGNRTQLARALHNLGVIYALCGDTSRAKAHNDEALRLAEKSGVGRIVALATVVDGLLIAELGDVDAGEQRLREGLRLQTHESAERPLEAMLELADFQLRWRSLDAAADTLREVECGLTQHGSALLRARTDLLRGRVLAATGEDDAMDVLRRARDQFQSLGRRLFVRDAEVSLACSSLAQGQRETCRFHLSAARAVQAEVTTTVPPELVSSFVNAHAQQQVALVEARLPESGPATPASAAPQVVTEQKTPDRSVEWNQRYGGIVGDSGKLQRVFQVLDRVVECDDTVLINGESGTGKELVAEAIHRNSVRSAGPFVKLNCAALVESLLLSELFGHERGAFTGAHQRKMGRFEMAAGGTIFLDEIGDISPKTQVALLRVLQEREFERVGGSVAITVDARIIFATNKNLSRMVKDGTFREDLYYRLKGISVDLPPLRERPDDIPALAAHFLSRYAAESDSPAKSLSADAVHLLRRYSWPGNIRELENIIRSVALFAEGAVIDTTDFDEFSGLFEDGHTPAEPATGDLKTARVEPIASTVALAEPSAQRARTAEEMQGDLLMAIFKQGVPLPELKKRIQDQAIAQALALTQGNITRAADVLGMRRPRLSQIINASEALKALAQGVSK